MIKLIEILKIAGGMLLSYLVVSVVGSRLFISNSPKLNMEYIASLRELPSYTKVQVASLASLFSNNDAEVQKQVDKFKKETGVIEVAISPDEEKKLVDSVGLPTNPKPNAVFNYMSKGVAASEVDKDGQVVLRVDEATQKEVEYRRFTRPDGTTLDIMILP